MEKSCFADMSDKEFEQVVGNFRTVYDWQKTKDENKILWQDYLKSVANKRDGK